MKDNPELHRWLKDNIPSYDYRKSVAIFSGIKDIELTKLIALYQLGAESRDYDIDMLNAEIKGLQAALSRTQQVARHFPWTEIIVSVTYLATLATFLFFYAHH